jgi:transposase
MVRIGLLETLERSKSVVAQSTVAIDIEFGAGQLGHRSGDVRRGRLDHRLLQATVGVEVADIEHSVLPELPQRFVAKVCKQDILLVLDGAPNHLSGDLAVPRNITLQFLPPYAPELNPKENLWDEIREKVFKNYALKSIDAVHVKLNEAIAYINRRPELVKSITSFPYIVRSLWSGVVSDVNEA